MASASARASGLRATLPSKLSSCILLLTKESSAEDRTAAKRNVSFLYDLICLLKQPWAKTRRHGLNARHRVKFLKPRKHRHTLKS